MKKSALILLLLVSCVAFAANTSGTGIFGSLAGASGNPLLSRLQNETLAFNITGEAGLAAFMQQRTLVVMGSGVDGEEKAAFEAVKAARPEIGNATQVMDTADALAQVDSGRYYLIVLVGGPSQNAVTKSLSSRKLANATNDSYAGMTIAYGLTENGSLIMTVSDSRGYYNAPRASAGYSPLTAFIPAAYIPIAATGISAVLLALISIVRTVFEFKALDVGRKGRKVGESRLMFRGIDLMEPLAIMGASLVLGVSMSWQYFGPSADFAWWVAVSSAICLFAAILHEVSHRLAAHAFGFRVEYRFWPAGSLLTLVSSWLGNAFSVQGFLLEEIPENAVKWKVALMRIAGPLVSTATMVSFALLNAVFPSVYFQLIFSISALWAVAEVFPFSGLDGKDLKDWNLFVWLFTFLIVGGAYVFVTFIL